MGKGDKKSKKGKRFMGSAGKTRLQKKKATPVSDTSKVKPKKEEQDKKTAKAEA